MEKIGGKKLSLAILFIFVFIFIFLFGVRAVFYVKFLLGSDVLVSLNANQESFILLYGEKDIVEFTTRVTANPLCQVNCNSKFIDLGLGEIVEESSSKVNLADPFIKKYELSADKIGKGQEIYRFDVECKGTKTFLCDTTDEIKRRSIIITMNYDLDKENQKLKNQSYEKLAFFFNYLNSALNKLESFSKSADEMNNFTNIQIIYLSINQTNQTLNKIDLKNIEDYWNNYQFESLNQEIENRINSSFQEFKLLNQSFDFQLKNYNYFIEELNQTKENLKNLSLIAKEIKNQTLFLEVNKLIEEFNSVIDFVNRKNNLNDKFFKLNLFNQSLKEINPNDFTSSNSTIILMEIKNSSLRKIELNIGNKTFYRLLGEPKMECCLFGDCKKCCDENCRNNPEKYPVIFLHGHHFNKELSVDYKIDTFNEIQRLLEEEGFLDAGAISLYSPFIPDNEWAMINAPITIKLSYYYSVFKSPDHYVVVQTKSENIDSYAIRLDELVKEVKRKTGRDKVIIVAHSMGGLVARRYVQIFGENSVDKILFIGTPHKGVTDEVTRYCSFFGENLECADMNSESLFMNRLNAGNQPKIPLYNIYGIGCNMNGIDGDGIVLTESAFLEGAKNYGIPGNCTIINPLHTQMLKVEKYPQVYEIIKEFLEIN